MKVRAYAKVNLALDVVRKRADGYHDLEMVMAPITLHDLFIFIELIKELKLHQIVIVCLLMKKILCIKLPKF